MSAPRIRVLLVEDHLPTQELIVEHLRRDPAIDLVAQTGNGAWAVELSQRFRPEIVLMDLALPGLDGLQATAAIHDVCPQTRVIMLTNYGFRDLQDRAREANQTLGSAAFLAKKDIAAQLLPVIHSVALGGDVRRS